jgi:DNA primase
MEVNILKELANQSITKVFDALHIQYVDKYDYLQSSCPIHGGDNPTAFSWVKQKGYFRCFTRRCERGGADVIDLVRKLKKCSFQQAVELLMSIVVTESYVESGQTLEDDIAFQRYIKNNAPRKKNTQVYQEEDLDRLKLHPYLLERGFTQEIIDTYRCGYCDNPDSVFYRRYCIPVRDENNNIVGVTGRAIFDFKAEKSPKWVHTHGMTKAEVLFNLNRALPSIKETHAAILVEGPLDVLRFEMAGIHNSVAVLGSSLSGPQRSLLLAIGCYDLILAFDNDEAGRVCEADTVKQCKNYFHLSKYVLQESKDIGELSVDEIKNLGIISL